LKTNIVIGLAVGVVLVLVVVFLFSISRYWTSPWNGGLYTDPDQLFSFEAPEGWWVDEFEEDARSKVAFDSPEGNESIVIIVEQYLEANNITEAEKKRLHTYPGEALTILEQSIIIDGVDGWEVRYWLYSEDMGLHGAVFIKNGYWHTITYTCPESPSESPFWSQLLQSFKSLG
jgi:hypothetical protein